MRANEFITDDWKDVASTAAMFIPGVAPIAKAYNVGKNLYQVGKAVVDYKKTTDDLNQFIAQQQSAQKNIQDVSNTDGSEIASIDEAKLVDYEGLTLKITKQGHVLMVDALDDWGNKVLGHVKFNIGDGKELDPQDLAVDDKYQGQGIARVMYDYVKSLGYTIVRSWDQTDAGKGFWDKHRGEDVRVWEQGVAEGRKPFRDLKSWANHAKSQGLKVSKSSKPLEWSYDATDKEGNVRGRFVGSNIPQNSRGFIHQHDVA